MITVPPRSSSTSAVPPENVLDLRRPAPTRPRPRRAEVLEAFWRRPGQAAPARPRRPWPRLRWSAPGLRLGLFPVTALGLVLLFAVGLSIVQVVGLRARVLEVVMAGYRALSVAAAQAAGRDMTAAQATFDDAEQQFALAQQSFDALNPTLAALLIKLPIAGSKLQSAQHLVSAAQAAARAGARFSTLAVPLSQDGEGFSEAASLIANLERDRASLQQIVTDLVRAADELAQVKPNDVPAPYGPAVAQAQQFVPGLQATLAGLEDGTLVLAEVLGVDQPVEYLFAFQNANELRASGGFVGSFALIGVDHGVFRILDAPNRGSLGVDDYLPPTVRPPLPLQIITPSWYFRDANWYPDWPTSAQQLSKFYQQARGFAPQGVVGLTHRLIERLLDVTGPIELPAYGVIVNQENFARVAQEQIELKYDLRVNDPKKFIVDLIPLLAERLAELELGQYPALLAAALESVAAGDLQLWSAAPDVQQRIAQLGWSGAMNAGQGDYFALIDSNIGGGKTDEVIDEQIEHRVDVDRSGRAIATIEVTRTHRGTPGDPFTGYRNRTYHRFYVPRGSRLLEASGFSRLPSSLFMSLPPGSQPDPLLSNVEGRVVIDEQTGTRINDEFGLTVFGNWTELDPGQATTVRLSYELPLTLEADFERYDLAIGRQAGAPARTYRFTLSLGQGKVVLSSVKKLEKLNTRQYTHTSTLTFPESISLVLKR